MQAIAAIITAVAALLVATAAVYLLLRLTRVVEQLSDEMEKRRRE